MTKFAAGSRRRRAFRRKQSQIRQTSFDRSSSSTTRRLEEDHLFPRFRKKNKLVDLVDTLDAQHKSGRRVTERILSLARAGLKSDADKQALSTALHQFVRMYAPHEAREDTVLFPAFRELVSKNEYAALGEDFEKREHQLFGKEGFEGMVEKVGGIEKTLGIYDLKQFTPRV